MVKHLIVHFAESEIGLNLVDLMRNSLYWEPLLDSPAASADHLSKRLKLIYLAQNSDDRWALQNRLGNKIYERHWFLKSELSLYQALITNSDTTYLYYDYSVDFVKIAQVRIHQKRETIETNTNLLIWWKSIPPRFYIGVPSKLRNCLQREKAPIFLQWLGPKILWGCFGHCWMV